MIKQMLEKFQKDIGEIFKGIPLHPNHITLASVLFAILGSYFIFLARWEGLLLFLIAFLIDGLDGAVARSKNLVSPFGAYIDGICDRIVEFFALLPLILNSEYTLAAVLVLFFGTCMTSFSKAYADHRNICDAKTASKLRTLFPRTERTIAIFISLILYLQQSEYLAIWIWACAVTSIVAFINLQFEAYCKATKNGQTDE